MQTIKNAYRNLLILNSCLLIFVACSKEQSSGTDIIIDLKKPSLEQAENRVEHAENYTLAEAVESLSILGDVLEQDGRYLPTIFRCAGREEIPPPMRAACTVELSRSQPKHLSPAMQQEIRKVLQNNLQQPSKLLQTATAITLARQPFYLRSGDELQIKKNLMQANPAESALFYKLMLVGYEANLFELIEFPLELDTRNPESLRITSSLLNILRPDDLRRWNEQNCSANQYLPGQFRCWRMQTVVNVPQPQLFITSDSNRYWSLYQEFEPENASLIQKNRSLK